MIATLAPCCAAASAARWPARPAPMIKTSCAGISARRPLLLRGSWPRGEALVTCGPRKAAPGRPAPLPGGRHGPGGSAGRTWCERDHALQHASLSTATIAPRCGEPFGAQQRFQRRLGGRSARRHVGLQRRRSTGRRQARLRISLSTALLADHPEEVLGRGRRRRTRASGSAGRTASWASSMRHSAGIVTAGSMMSPTAARDALAGRFALDDRLQQRPDVEEGAKHERQQRLAAKGHSR